MCSVTRYGAPGDRFCRAGRLVPETNNHVLQIYHRSHGVKINSRDSRPNAMADSVYCNLTRHQDFEVEEKHYCRMMAGLLEAGHCSCHAKTRNGNRCPARRTTVGPRTRQTRVDPQVCRQSGHQPGDRLHYGSKTIILYHLPIISPGGNCGAKDQQMIF